TMLRSKYAELPARRTRRTAISPPVVVSARAKCQARWRRWVAIVSSWDTVDSSDKYCVPVLRTASCPASMAGPIAVRSTQFGAGKALVFACDLILVTGYIFPPSCTSTAPVLTAALCLPLPQETEGRSTCGTYSERLCRHLWSIVREAREWQDCATMPRLPARRDCGGSHT